MIVSLLGLIKGLSELTLWLERRAERVKRSEDAARVITSSGRSLEKNMPAVVQRTDGGRPADGPPAPVYSRDVLLDTYKWLRRLGATREEARIRLKAIGIPLSNDLWAKAEPPPPPELDEDDALYETPIAGRATDATFRDPLLEYQPPPR